MWNDFSFFVLVGAAAQLVDGAIGMAYGVTATSILMSYGVAPATASAAIHAAEVFTTAASTAAHWRLGNVRWDLVKRLAVPGVVGAVAGATLLSYVPGRTIQPFVSAYLLALGVLIVWRAAWEYVPNTPPVPSIFLGLIGGFLDAVGGGGWGAMVTTTLIATHNEPRYAIGSASAAEFFVTAAATGTFVMTIGLSLWPVILGLVAGGVVAAPLAALIARHVAARPIMLVVGIVVIALSTRNLLGFFQRMVG
jgi:uncharacterized protein